MSINSALTLRASSLGDSLMGKYFLENVHAYAPHARCTLLVASRSGMIKDLLEGYEWLEVVEVNRKHPLNLFKAWQGLRGEDITLTQYSERSFSLPSKLFARAVTKRGGLVGFKDPFWGNNLLYDVLLPFRGEKKSEGMIAEEQKALAAAGVPVAVTDLSLTYRPDEAVLQKFALEPKQYIIAHLFAGSEGRSISQEKRTTIIRVLREALPAGYLLVLTGVSGELARLEQAGAGLAGVVTVAGKTSVQELINLIANARAVVALDSGAAHIAAHLRAPLVVLTRSEAKQGWWSSAMYNNRPTTLTNEEMNDEGPRPTPYPPSLETIEVAKIVAAVSSLI